MARVSTVTEGAPSINYRSDMSSLLVRLVEENIAAFAVDEGSVGIVARAVLRARRDGDKEAAKRFATPFFNIFHRVATKKKPSHDYTYRLTRKEMAEMERLAREITNPQMEHAHGV